MSSFSDETVFRSRNRLKDKTAFQNVFSSKKRISAKQFVLIARNNGGNFARLGLAVPKKHINSAVKRNRIKRVLRESFRFKQTQFKGFDLVILVRRPLNDIDKNSFDMILEDSWRKIQCAD